MLKPANLAMLDVLLVTKKDNASLNVMTNVETVSETPLTVFPARLETFLSNLPTGTQLADPSVMLDNSMMLNQENVLTVLKVAPHATMPILATNAETDH